MVQDVMIHSNRKKTSRQEILGVIVNKNGGEFVFNFSTSRDPAPAEIEVFKEFRNIFIKALENTNEILEEFS